MPYNVLVADDQNMSRQLFELYVNTSENYRLVMSLDSATGLEAYPARFDIDLILLDVVMRDGVNGLDAAERIKRSYPEIKIIMVTSMPEGKFLRRAREIGVESFWYKEVGGESLLSVMDRTMAGESVYPDSSPVIALGQASSTDFTQRELDILRVLVSGCSNEEIAARLNVGLPTVRTHISHMLEKTGFRSRTELALAALKSGVVVPD